MKPHVSTAFMSIVAAAMVLVTPLAVQHAAFADCVSTTVAGATSVRCSDGSRATSTTVGGVTTNYFSDGTRTSDSTERGSSILDRRDTRSSVGSRTATSSTTRGSTILRSTAGGSGTPLP